MKEKKTQQKRKIGMILDLIIKKVKKCIHQCELSVLMCTSKYARTFIPSSGSVGQHGLYEARGIESTDITQHLLAVQCDS